MTGADLFVLEEADCSPSSGGDERWLPQHFCGRCMALAYGRDRRCVQCERARPQEGWPRLCDSGDPWLGRIMQGRYLITRRLGKGATATVYEAESLQIPRQFAIKVVDLKACAENKEPKLVRARLDREVRAIGRLRNPHTVPLYEVLELSEACVGVVMNFVEGRTLDRLLAEDGPMEYPRACRLLRQMANGAHAVHEAGLIHRDLKPANIMVERTPSGDDFVHLLDFGIVWMDDGVEVTQGFVGTPLYASPEQALGERVDRRSDIYSLGAIFFQMLTGRPPFDSRKVMEVLRMHVRQTPPDVVEAADGRPIPYRVRRLVERMLAKSRHARPIDLGEVIETIDAILDGDAGPVERGCADARRSETQLPEVEQTAPGLGVIESVAEQEDRHASQASAAPVDERAEASTVDTAPCVSAPQISQAFFDEAISALDCLGDVDSFFESTEHDATGPKAVIFRPRAAQSENRGPRAP